MISSLNQTQMVESGLMGGFWYRALVDAKDTRNVTYHDQIKTTPYHFIHGEPKNLSKFRAFGCRTQTPYLKEDRQEKGKHIPRAVEASRGVNISFAQESSGYCHIYIYIPTLKKAIITNHIRFTYVTQDRRGHPGYRAVQLRHTSHQ